MTDFFSELEGHLHAGASRRARRNRIRPVAGTALAALAALAIVFGLAAQGEDREREVAAPVVTAAPSDCAPALDVLRKPAGEPIPAGIRARVEQDFPGEGRPLEIDFPGARLAAERHWVVPVRFADGCGVVVITIVSQAMDLPAWGTNEELETYGINLLAGPPSVWLVPNGAHPMLSTKSGPVRGKVTDNVFTADGDGELVLNQQGGEGAGEAEPGCATEPQLTKDPVPIDLLQRFAILRDGSAGHASLARGGVQQVFTHGIRTLSGYAVIPVTLGCTADDAEPGMCLETEGRSRCAAVTGEPFLLSLSTRKGDQIEIAALVSDDPGAVVIGDNHLSSSQNLTVTQVPGTDPGAITVRLP
jgi:hypothetical protein